MPKWIFQKTSTDQQGVYAVILTGHVIFKLRYNQIYQLKTTDMSQVSQSV